MNKAELTRIVELDRASRGLKTERSLQEMLIAQKEVAKKYILTPSVTGGTSKPTTE